MYTGAHREDHWFIERQKIRSKCLFQGPGARKNLSVITPQIAFNVLSRTNTKLIQNYQVMKERNDAQLLAKSSMQEKASYRRQLHELECKFDDVTQQLLQCQKQLMNSNSVNFLSKLTEFSNKICAKLKIILVS